LAQIKRPVIRQQLITSVENTAKGDVQPIVTGALQVAHFKATITVLFSPN